MRRAAGLLPLLLALATSSVRAETPIPPAPDRWVTDRAGFLSPAAVTELDGRLAAYARGTGHQILVYIDRTTGGIPIEDWGVHAFEKWRIGRSGIDDGLAMFVFSEDRRVRIEVGYGLEDRVPDVVAKRIIEERVLPRIAAGDHDGAIRAGVAALTSVIGGQGAGAGEPPAPAPVPLWKLIVGGLAFLLLIGFLITHPSLAWLLLLSIGGGRGGGGFSGGGGGGFSGGGGRSGGGGASGSW